MAESSDSMPLINRRDKKSKTKTRPKEEFKDEDDIAGMLVSAGKSINYREMIIIWLWFLLIHSEIFVERILAVIKGTVDENNNMTMMGTIYSSFVMIIGVIIIDMVYR